MSQEKKQKQNRTGYEPQATLYHLLRSNLVEDTNWKARMDDKDADKMVGRFNGTNWPTWSSRMKDYLAYKGLIGVLESESGSETLDDQRALAAIQLRVSDAVLAKVRRSTLSISSGIYHLTSFGVNDSSDRNENKIEKGLL